MTPEKQRLALAEWDGKIKPGNPLNTKGGVLIPYKMADGLDDIPDYLNDLNAMHEVEKIMGVDCYPLRERYLYTLMDIVKRDSKRMAVCATASQRAEALLKTLGLWEDEK